MKSGHLIIISKLLLALLLASAGAMKLMGIEEVHLSFQALGLPYWFGYFIGLAELAIAIGLFSRPNLIRLAAAGSIAILLGASYYHIMFTPLIEAMTAAIELALSLFIFFRVKNQPIDKAKDNEQY